MPRWPFIVAIIVLALALMVWRLEPLYLGWLAARTDAQDLAERKELIAQGAEIHLPEAGDGPFPTILLFHGCAGPRMAFQRQWADLATAAGYGAIIVDSTGPRGYDREGALDAVCGGKTLLGQERAGDVVAAIEIARADPRLDVETLVLAGWSHGAWTVMDFLTMDLESDRPAGLTGALPAPPALDGVVLFYPHCGVGALSKFRAWRDDAPMIAFVAGKDSIVDGQACIRLFEKRKTAGVAVDLTVYPDAEHVFDDPFLEPEWIHWYDAELHADAAQKVRDFLARARD